MRQLLNRTLVLSPDSLKTMLHPISLLVASASVVIAALMTVDDTSARTGLRLTVLEEARRHATGRLPGHIIVSRRLKDMVVSFPEIRTRGLVGTGLPRALLRCRLGRAPTDNVRRRRRRRSIFVHDEWGIGPQGIFPISIIMIAHHRSLLSVGVLGWLRGLIRCRRMHQFVCIVVIARSVLLLRFHGLRGWNSCTTSYLFKLLLAEDVKLSGHGSATCTIFRIWALQAQAPILHVLRIS